MTGEIGTGKVEVSRVPNLLLILVLVLASFVQLTVVSKTVVDHPLRADAGEYFSYAYNLKHFGVYSSARTWEADSAAVAPVPDKLRSPGYPLFLLAAGSPEPTEAYLRRVSFLQAGLGIVSVWLAYLIAACFLDKRFAIAVALLATISPHLTIFSTYLLSESLFTFLLLASTLALIKSLLSGRLMMWAATGALWGLCSLVRPTAEFFPLLLMLLVLALPRLRSLGKPVALSLLCFAVVMSPWVVRNQSVGQAGPSLMVNSMAHGAYPGFMYEDRPETFAFPYRFDPEYPKHIQSLPTVLHHISNRLAAEPAKYFGWYLFGKPYFFLSLEDVQAFDIMIYPTIRTPYYESAGFALMRIASIWLHWPLMLLGLAGTILLAWRPEWLGLSGAQLGAARLLGLLLGYAIALHMVAAPFPRYAIPFRPLIYALACLPLQAVWSRLRKKRLAA